MNTTVQKSHIAHEKKIIAKMISIYCKGQKHDPCLCENCKSLLEYACNRLDKCHFGELKGSCKECKIHCYHTEYKEKIRVVMRYAGPRMIWYAPITTIKHWFF